MSEIQKVNEADLKLADYSNLKPEEVAVIKNTVAKGCTNTELAYFLSVCQSQGLNPFNKEVWCYKDGKGNLIILAGRDGMLAKGQKHPRWNGIRSAVVRENDEFEIDIANAKITHKANWKEPGRIIGAYAIVFLAGGEPTISWVLMKEFDKGYNAWKSNPSDMILKTAESKALKKAFGFSGIQIAEEWRETSSGKIEPIQEAEIVSQEEADQREATNRTIQWIKNQTNWQVIELSITPQELEVAEIAQAYNEKKDQLCSK
jgi:phage recombination protein Bet